MIASQRRSAEPADRLSYLQMGNLETVISSQQNWQRDSNLLISAGDEQPISQLVIEANQSFADGEILDQLIGYPEKLSILT